MLVLLDVVVVVGLAVAVTAATVDPALGTNSTPGALELPHALRPAPSRATTTAERTRFLIGTREGSETG